jgi:hypothetical protein
VTNQIQPIFPDLYPHQKQQHQGIGLKGTLCRKWQKMLTSGEMLLESSEFPEGIIACFLLLENPTGSLPCFS